MFHFFYVLSFAVSRRCLHYSGAHAALGKISQNSWKKLFASKFENYMTFLISKFCKNTKKYTRGIRRVAENLKIVDESERERESM